MIGNHWIKGGAQGAVQYYSEHLQQGDYYMSDKSDSAPSEWLGKGAESLGLSGDVTKEQFTALANNQHPETGDTLTQRKNGENARTFWDVTISPPKEFSIMAMMGDEETKGAFKELHREAVKIASGEIEANLGRRMREGDLNGSNETKITANAIIATVEHDTARPVDGVPDPHLHTHMLFMNATQDPDNGKFYALDNSEAISATHMARQAYYSHLVEGLEEMGYKTETREAQKDFKIVGFSEDLRESFSRREKQVLDTAKEKMDKYGMVHQDKANSESAKASREQKVTLTDSEKVEAWENMAGKDGMSHLADMKEKAKERAFSVDASHAHSSLSESVEHAKNTIFENNSVVHTNDLEREILRAGRGNFSLPEMREAIAKDKDIITKGRETTTQAVISEERAFLNEVNKGVGMFPTLKKEGYQSKDSPKGEKWKYSNEQKQAIDGVLESKDFVVAVNGVAGAGKTSMLKEIESGIKSNRGKVLTLAPSNAAKNVLIDEGFKNSQTMQQYLANPKLREKTKGQTIVLDEAGMVSSRDMARLTTHAKNNSNRIVLVGDVKQLSSVQRGDGFRLVQDHTKAKTFTIEESNRQKNMDYKRAVGSIRHASSRGQYQTAFERMNDYGILKEVEGTDNARENLVKQVADTKINDSNRLVVASKWETIHAVNSEVREQLKEAGKLSKQDHDVTTLENKNMKKGELSKARFFEKGDVIELTKKNDFGEKGKRFTVQENRGNGYGLQVLDENGKARDFPQGKLARDEAFNVFKERDLKISAGDTILIQGNQGNVTNGDKMKITAINDGRITVQKFGENGELEKAKKLPKDFDKYVHSYAVTAHASQGQTVDKVTVIADGMDKKGLYVAVSRGKHDAEVLTTNKTNLEAQLTNKEETRKSGIELISKTAERFQSSKVKDSNKEEKEIVDEFKDLKEKLKALDKPQDRKKEEVEELEKD